MSGASSTDRADYRNWLVAYEGETQVSASNSYGRAEKFNAFEWLRALSLDASQPEHVQHHAAIAFQEWHALAQRSGGPSLPSGWLAVPVQATMAMHNSAAFADLYQPPQIVYGDNGNLRIQHGCPDWSRVWRVMVEASPRLDATQQRLSKEG